MAKDYFEDIVPPENGGRRSVPINTNPAPIAEEDNEPENYTAPTPEKSIRNISMPQRVARRPAPDMSDMRQPTAAGILGGAHAPRVRSRWWMWIAAGISVLILGSLALLALRSTTVTVTPRSQTVVFDQTAQFIAYPSATAAAGTLSYTVQTVELEDSEVVASSGTVKAEDKASGTITVFNDYSTDGVKLIKNTRFQSANGLIFRTPAEIVVPGKKGATPGEVRVTVVADQAGESYNVAAGRFTVPGLQSSPDMYAKVYGRSDAAMTGGFVGDKPGVADGALQGAIAQVRSRLEQKARDSALAQSTDTATAFADIARISYQSLPSTSEAGGGVRIHEKARVEVPVFESAKFASAVARMVSADAESASIRIEGVARLVAQPTSTSTVFLSDPLQFTLTGTAELVWNIDELALTTALAGKDKSAFQSIVTGFPGIQNATARIQPFWSSVFPTSPADIKVKIEEPTDGA